MLHEYDRYTTSANKEGNINIKEFTDHYFITHKETAKTSLLEKEIAERAKKFSDYIDPENSGYVVLYVIYPT